MRERQKEEERGEGKRRQCFWRASDIPATNRDDSTFRIGTPDAGERERKRGGRERGGNAFRGLVATRRGHWRAMEASMTLCHLIEYLFERDTERRARAPKEGVIVREAPERCQMATMTTEWQKKMQVEPWSWNKDDLPCSLCFLLNTMMNKGDCPDFTPMESQAAILSSDG